MSLEGRPSLGRRDAPVAMVEFTDYQCPFCSRFHQQTFPALKRKYMDSGRVRYVVADLPLSIHPQAERGAQAAHCAGEQGRYFPMQEALFRHTATLGPEAMVKAAGEAGLAAEAFQACLASGRHLEAIRASASLAAGLGIRGTPSFILGRIGADGELEGLRLVGAQPLEAFEQRIEALLKP
jgi:protein-disulfide isomerase